MASNSGVTVRVTRARRRRRATGVLHVKVGWAGDGGVLDEQPPTVEREAGRAHAAQRRDLVRVAGGDVDPVDLVAPRMLGIRAVVDRPAVGGELRLRDDERPSGQSRRLGAGVGANLVEPGVALFLGEIVERGVVGQPAEIVVVVVDPGGVVQVMERAQRRSVEVDGGDPAVLVVAALEHHRDALSVASPLQVEDLDRPGLPLVVARVALLGRALPLLGLPSCLGRLSEVGQRIFEDRRQGREVQGVDLVGVEVQEQELLGKGLSAAYLGPHLFDLDVAALGHPERHLRRLARAAVGRCGHDEQPAAVGRQRRPHELYLVAEIEGEGSAGGVAPLLLALAFSALLALAFAVADGIEEALLLGGEIVVVLFALEGILFQAQVGDLVLQPVRQAADEKRAVTLEGDALFRGREERLVLHRGRASELTDRAAREVLEVDVATARVDLALQVLREVAVRDVDRAAFHRRDLPEDPAVQTRLKELALFAPFRLALVVEGLSVVSPVVVLRRPADPVRVRHDLLERHLVEAGGG